MTDITTTLMQIQPADLIKLRNFLFVSVTIPLLLFLVKRTYDDYKKRQTRRRDLYAKAFAICMEYKEFPFVIYRRGSSNPEAERLRISEAMRGIQKNLAYYTAWLKTESREVSDAYVQLVKKLRDIPGNEMKKAWKTTPITKDKQMIIENPIDWGDLADFEDKYIEAVKHALSPWRRTNSYIMLVLTAVFAYLAARLLK